MVAITVTIFTFPILPFCSRRHSYPVDKFKKNEDNSNAMYWCFRVSLSSSKFPRGFFLRLLTGIFPILYLHLESNNFRKKKLMILVIRASCISTAYFGISAEMPLIEAALEPFRFKIILY